jgi:hypothetical protein
MKSTCLGAKAQPKNAPFTFLRYYFSFRAEDFGNILSSKFILIEVVLEKNKELRKDRMQSHLLSFPNVLTKIYMKFSPIVFNSL